MLELVVVDELRKLPICTGAKRGREGYSAPGAVTRETSARGAIVGGRSTIAVDGTATATRVASAGLSRPGPAEARSRGGKGRDGAFDNLI